MRVRVLTLIGKTHVSYVRQDFTYGTPPPSQEGRHGYATYQCMHEHNLYSLRYLCTFSYSKNNSKFTGSLLKIYVCDVNKTLLSMKVKNVYVIQNGNILVALFRVKIFGTPFGSYLISFIFISMLFLYSKTPMEHFFKHV